MLVDNFGRSFKYLRLSLTEKCNFRCSYCLPNGYSSCHREAPLNIHEIENLASAFANLGVEKIRLTGGEPTLRSDVAEIISMLKSIHGIETVALTTNGYRLPKILNQLSDSGLDALNVSLDSLDPKTFQAISGFDYCESIKNSVDRSLALGLKKIKVNAVLLKDINSEELFNFIRWIQTRPLSVRFIELMRTSDNADYFKKHYLPVSYLQNQMTEMGWSMVNRDELSGPANEYSHSEYAGRIGFISAYSKDFCASCNRLRISANGGLRLCLFGDGNMNLRPLLQRVSQQELLLEKICQTLKLKPLSHNLHNGYSGDMASLSAIGG